MNKYGSYTRKTVNVTAYQWTSADQEYVENTLGGQCPLQEGTWIVRTPNGNGETVVQYMSDKDFKATFEKLPDCAG